MGIPSPPFHTGDTTPELVGHPARMFMPIAPDPGMGGMRVQPFFHTGQNTPARVQHAAPPAPMGIASPVGNL